MASAFAGRGLIYSHVAKIVIKIRPSVIFSNVKPTNFTEIATLWRTVPAFVSFSAAVCGTAPAVGSALAGCRARLAGLKHF